MFHDRKKHPKPPKARPNPPPATIEPGTVKISYGVTDDGRIAMGVDPVVALWFWGPAAAEAHANEILRIVRGIREGKSKDQIVREGKP